MTTSKELNLARKSLVTSLGENAKVYFDKMKLWFQMKTTKEEFDCEARNIMTEEQVRLHNEFLLCLFNKVRGLAAATPTCKIDRDKTAKERRLRLKRKYKTDKSNFEPADMYVEVPSQASSPVRDEPVGANHSSAQELILPDRTFVLARLMLAAWENNMDGAKEDTAHIIIAATQIFLKNILTAIFTRRKGYAVRDNSFIYNIGEPVPSSWKRNSMYISPFNSGPTEVIESYGQVPASQPYVEEAEQATAFSYACSTQVVPPPLKPVSTADLQHALKIYKNLVSNHTIYATNMERLYTYATHPTWEDLEAKKLLCQSST
ncbi:hypothetical protein DMN91_012453 [Ooceraea biroi]|uniref:Uncharacterized protein n=1 Tax=Ooceraea biroi TaxID=2015173 RepID=A0A3L8D5E8_OOCBI|nr:transcriptional adapter 1 [Ooceraea biroi]RLU15459.1 hypothetical protein DMN91_012453 [Ooceraea biroi]